MKHAAAEMFHSSKRSNPSVCVYACGAWTRWRASSKAPGPGARSCCGRSWTRRGRCASRTRRPSRWWPWCGARPGSCPTTASPSALGPGDVAIIRGPTPYTVADDPATPPQAVDPSRAALHDPRRREPRRGHGPRCADLGQQHPGRRRDALTGTYQTDGEVSRRLLDALPAADRAASGHVDLPLDPVAGRGDHQGRAGAGGRARPAARPAARRRAAGVVLPARGRGAGVVPRPQRPGRRARRCG